jgi:hypothetical protein
VGLSMNAQVFGHLRMSDLDRIREMVQNGRAQEIQTHFAEWLSMWKDGEWIDEVKITSHINDLRHQGLWNQASYSMFLEEVRSKVSPRVFQILERA